MPIIYFFYPETSNISLEDIDKIFLKEGENDDSSERSSTIADNESAEMRVRTEEREKVDGKHVEEV